MRSEYWVIIATFFGGLAAFSGAWYAQRQAEFLRHRHDRDVRVAETRVAWIVRVQELIGAWYEGTIKRITQRRVGVSYTLDLRGADGPAFRKIERVPEATVPSVWREISEARVIAERIGDEELSVLVSGCYELSGKLAAEDASESIMQEAAKALGIERGELTDDHVVEHLKIRETTRGLGERFSHLLGEIQDWYEEEPQSKYGVGVYTPLPWRTPK